MLELFDVHIIIVPASPVEQPWIFDHHVLAQSVSDAEQSACQVFRSEWPTCDHVTVIAKPASSTWFDHHVHSDASQDGETMSEP